MSAFYHPPITHALTPLFVPSTLAICEDFQFSCFQSPVLFVKARGLATSSIPVWSTPGLENRCLGQDRGSPVNQLTYSPLSQSPPPRQPPPRSSVLLKPRSVRTLCPRPELTAQLHPRTCLSLSRAQSGNTRRKEGRFWNVKRRCTAKTFVSRFDNGTTKVCVTRAMSIFRVR
jgi:hypothetical protein